MARFMRTIAIFIISALAGSCGKSLLIEEAQMPEPPVEKGPVGYIPVGENLVDVVFDDGSKVEVEYNFRLTAQPLIKVAGTEPIAPVEELAKHAAEQLVFAYNYGISNTVKANIVVEYRYNGTDYQLNCLEPDMMTVNGVRNVKDEETNPAYYELSETVYTLDFAGIELASATQLFEVEEGYVPPTFDHVEWDYSHKNYRREATYANGILTVVCDNVANFADIYSDGSRQNEESVDYTVSNKFAFNAPVLKVDELSTVVGCTFTFSNGVVTVANQTVSAVWKSAAVDGEVMHNDKDYASEITPCKVEAKSITFVSANQAVIRFYDNNANDYAEATVAVTIEENRRLLSTDDSYSHVAYRRNAEVSGSNIAVTCDNLASFIDNYSDGTTESENVDYNVVNNFSYVVPSIVTNNIANLLGQSYSFNAGTAVIEGVNVSINFTNRQVSAIMHNGKDYRSNAPVCEVVAKTITITSQTTATVRFEDVDDATDYSEAIITINVIEAEVVVGEIVGMWITDAYQGRTYTSTDLHILAKQVDGSYVTYSREIGEMSFTTTNLSAAEGQTVLNSGKALAWAYTPAKTRLLSLVDYIESSKEQTGYVIDYLDFNGQVLIALGDAEAALNGKPFAEPLKAVGSANSDGMWSVSYNGTTYYFVSK